MYMYNYLNMYMYIHVVTDWVRVCSGGKGSRGLYPKLAEEREYALYTLWEGGSAGGLGVP